MNLTEEQKAVVKQWIEEGLGAGEIQKRLKTEMGISCTYLELRFLLDDLKVVPKEKEEPIAVEQSDSPPSPIADEPLPADPIGTGRVRVSVDQITKPSALVSGKVTFSDGESAEWMIDRMGRPALVPSTPGYRPSQQDIMDFQMELQRLM